MTPTSEQRARAELQALREKVRRYCHRLKMREAVASAKLAQHDEEPDRVDRVPRETP